MKPVFFRRPSDFRKWLARRHGTARELLVGYYKKGSGRPSMTWPESVAEAICYGWIDGIRRSLDEQRYTIRFTPRRPRSVWSPTNIRMARELEAAGRMTAAGRAAFAARVSAKPAAPGRDHQRQPARLSPALLKRFKKNKAAWAFFQAQPPSYRNKAVGWVMGAKNEDTRESRFRRLLASAAAGKR